jgi:ElaB/YqjD/DUF883 family membrane-anchored ribosome-binding protein
MGLQGMGIQGNAPSISADFEVIDGVREVRDNVADAIDKSLESRPYTTLLLAVGLGFLIGALWAR